tara:strand:+ start:137 stop:619 length:483 start_codon:yes stop_codon:yes gene_type:complete
MAHFTRLDDSNVVQQVVSVADAVIDNGAGGEDEALGVTHLQSVYGETTNWKQCSYNTWAGKHHDENGDESADQSKSLRGNYPGIGWTYDSASDVFIAPKPFDSWVYNATDCKWEAPTSLESQLGESTEDIYKWDESSTSWVRLGARSETDSITDPGYVGP